MFISQRDVEAKLKQTNPNESKKYLAKTTLKGFVFTTRNYIELTSVFLQNHEYISPHCLSQDVLEIFFGTSYVLCEKIKSLSVRIKKFSLNFLQLKSVSGLKDALRIITGCLLPTITDPLTCTVRHPAS